MQLLLSTAKITVSAQRSRWNWAPATRQLKQKPHLLLKRMKIEFEKKESVNLKELFMSFIIRLINRTVWSVFVYLQLMGAFLITLLLKDFLCELRVYIHLWVSRNLSLFWLVLYRMNVVYLRTFSENFELIGQIVSEIWAYLYEILTESVIAKF